jgi:hypothetical protein
MSLSPLCVSLARLSFHISFPLCCQLPSLNISPLQMVCMIAKSSNLVNGKVSKSCLSSQLIHPSSFLHCLESVCPPLSPYASTLEPDNPNFLKTMNSLHPNWRSLIGESLSLSLHLLPSLPSPALVAVGYLNIRNYSFSHHDLHGEFGAVGFLVDCTHYAYTPYLMEPIWVTLEDYFSKFSMNTFLSSPTLSLSSRSEP